MVRQILPFLLRPSGKDYLWGGERLKSEFHKRIDLTPLAETWECSTHPNGPCYVVEPYRDDRTLNEILRLHPEYLGNKYQNEEGQLPILIKFIDADKDLSIQVHPDEDYARKNEHGAHGKTEMWYVLSAQPGATLVYGLKEGTTKESLSQALDQDQVEACLNEVLVKPGDTFFIPAGTVHAIKKGILVAEIQQSSDITYRLYDYNRVDKDGKKRPLHIQKALDVINFDSKIVCPHKEENRPGVENLVTCPLFTTDNLDTALLDPEEEYQVSDESFEVLLCYSGYGALYNNEEDFYLTFEKGDCIFLPASSVPFKVCGKAKLLHVTC